MSLAQLEIGLLWLTGSIAVIFILTIGTYYWYLLLVLPQTFQQLP